MNTENIKDLLSAFEMYYATQASKPKYNMIMKQELVDRYAWISPTYKSRLFDQIVSTFKPGYATPLPAVRDFAEATSKLGNPSMYELPDLDLIEDKTEEVFDKVLDEVDNRFGFGDYEGAQRIKALAKKGDASIFELWWLKCREEGTYRAMPDSFIEEHKDLRLIGPHRA